MMLERYDAIVIGAGPAGLTTAINLQMSGWKVLIIEKSSTPRTKVCGGFIGPENKELLAKWGILDDLMQHGAHEIKNIVLASADGSLVKRPILFNGKSDSAIAVSRKQLDWTLIKKARKLGVTVCDSSIASILDISSPLRTIQVKNIKNNTCNNVQTFHIINATGAINDMSLKHKGLFGVAANFKNISKMRENVYLYFDHHAHLGINRFENDETNICYVADYPLFQSMKGNMQNIFEKLRDANPLLKEQLISATRTTPWKGVFFSKSPRFRFYENAVFHVGDAVGQINPVVGGGNSIAISSAMILSELMKHEAPQNMSEKNIALNYEKSWKQNFAKRIQTSWILGKLAHNKTLSNYTIKLFQHSNTMLNKVFNHTHQTTKFDEILLKA